MLDVHTFIDFQGWIFVVLLYTAILLLTIIVPKFKIKGHVEDFHGKKLRYQLNGFRVLLVAFTSFIGVFWYYGAAVAAWPYEHIIGEITMSVILGISVSTIFYLMGPWKDHVTAPKRLNQPPNFIWDFFFGFELNPQVGWFDIKMWLYLLGAVVLEINLLSALAWQIAKLGIVTNTMMAYFFCLTWFVFDYLWNEHIHVTTYDIIDENIGFKLIWGCFAFYPYFYHIGVHDIVGEPRPVSTITAIAAVVVFLIGWSIARGANNQKYLFKSEPRAKYYLFGLIRQRSLGKRVLVSGFWGMARHFQYFGEIIMATGLAIPGVACGGWMPLLYPIYYMAILLPRERDDMRVCKAKYGEIWDEYVRQVPWRVIPGVY